MHKTNYVFNKICTALNLSAEQRSEWLAAAGHPIAKSKLTAWGSRGKNYQELPTAVLVDFLELAEIKATSPLVRVIAGYLSDRDDYERLTVDDMSALDELAKLLRREYGYTPQNLRLECTEAGGRPAFAEKHGLSESTLDNWCRQLDDPNHRDMPATKWQEIIKKIKKTIYIDPN